MRINLKYIAFACIFFGVAMMMYYFGIGDAIEYKRFVDANCKCFINESIDYSKIPFNFTGG